MKRKEKKLKNEKSSFKSKSEAVVEQKTSRAYGSKKN